MPARIPCRARSWFALVCTHNPCYVVSAVLVMYGLHLSFSGRLDPAQGWLLMQMLTGYTALLVAVAVAVVRLGRVWEDARTLVLLALLILVAISASFDRVCLDNYRLGASFLGTGLIFSIILSELLVRSLKVRLPWSYRAPLYLHLAILFVYPAWLGKLSLTDREVLMAWYVLGYTSWHAAGTLLLLPAVRRRGSDVVTNGTPWSWPWYPLSLLVVVAAGGLIRGFALSLSFSLSKGFVSGLAPYVLVPVILAWLLLWAEGAAIGGAVWRRWTAVIAGFSVLALALPGSELSSAQAVYLDMLQEALGSPIQIAAIMLIAYFSHLWRRGLATAEAGLIGALAVLAAVDRFTVDIHTLAPVQVVPAAVLIGLLVVNGVWRRSAARVCAAILLLASLAAYQSRDATLMADRGYVLIHLIYLAIMLTGLIFSDRAAKAIARAAPVALVVAALLAAVTYRLLFPATPTTWHGLYALGLSGMGLLYWLKQRRLSDLQAAIGCGLVFIGLCVESLVEGVLPKIVLRGKFWILWGGVFLLAGFLVSLVKGGQVRWIRRTLIRMNRALHRRSQPG